MKLGYAAALVVCVIFFTTTVSGCAGPDKVSNNTSYFSYANYTITPWPTPSISPAPVSVGYSDQIDISGSGPSKLFRLDNVSWSEYLVTLKLDNETSHLKQITEYTGSSAWDAYVWTIWMYEGNGSCYGFQARDGKLSANVYAGIMNGQRYLGSLVLPGAAVSKIKKLDLSATFDNTTDGRMKVEGFEPFLYKGDLYNCTVYDVQIENDSFRVWYNASLPLPPKIVADYADPGTFIYHRKGGTVSGPCTYDLLDWGTTKDDSPIQDYPVRMPPY